MYSRLQGLLRYRYAPNIPPRWACHAIFVSARADINSIPIDKGISCLAFIGIAKYRYNFCSGYSRANAVSIPIIAPEAPTAGVMRFPVIRAHIKKNAAALNPLIKYSLR